MLHLRNIGRFLLCFLLGQLQVQYTRAAWPSSNTSGIQLLGLFPDAENASASETTTLSVHSRAMFKAAIMLSQQFNMMIEGQFITWQTVQTGGSAIGAVSGTCRVMSTSNIIGIVGPSVSREAPLIANLGNTVGIPVISYGATDPALSNVNAYPTFYRTIPSDRTAALAVVKLFNRYNWTSCSMIYQNDEFGTGGLDAVSRAFEKNSLSVSVSLLFDTSTLTFRGDLKTTLLTSPTRIVLLWAEPLYSATILQYALDNDVVGPQFLWILCSSISFDSFSPTFYPKLVGIITVEPTIGTAVGASINTTLLNDAYNIWQQYEPETFPGRTQVHSYGLFAFDATWTLIQSLQKLCSTNINSSSSCLSSVTSSFCFDYRFLNTGSFINAIDTTAFLGVSGPVQFSSNTTDRIDGTYYISKNVQASSNGVNFVSVLQLSGSGDWQGATRASVIIWPGDSLTPPTGLPSLTGVTLRIGVIEVAPFTMKTKIDNGSGQTTTDLVGYAQDLISLLQIRMGFTSQIILVPSNQTYDQTIQAVANNVYDMVVSDVTVNAKRRAIADFSNSIYDNSLRIIVRETSAISIDILSFMRPFSPRLWLVIMGVLFYSAVILCIFERRENDALKEKSMVSLAAMSVWFCFGIMAGPGADFHVQTAAGRLLTMGLYIVSIILVASYTANLASDLTVAKSPNIISSIDDIKAGKIPFGRIGIVTGTAVEDYYLREISSGSRNFYPLKSQTDIYTSLLNNVIDASIYDTGLLEYETSTVYCTLTLVGSNFNPSAYGVVVPKGWLYSQLLDVNILSLRESGLLDVLQRRWFQGGTCGVETVTISASYTVESLCGLFMIFAIISVLSLLLFAWLKRLIIIDYFKSLAHRKGWLAKKDNADETIPTKNNNEPSKTHESDSVSSPATHGKIETI